MTPLQAMTDAIMWECGLTERAEDVARNAATAALTALAENITPEMVEAATKFIAAHPVTIELGIKAALNEAMCAAAVKGEGE